MILVVCPNLAVDHTLHVETLEVGRVHRSRDYQRRAGGKGVNMARALNTLGEKLLLCGFAGGAAGRFLEDELKRENVPAELVPMRAENRNCVIVLSRKGEATVVNEEGPTVTEVDALRLRVKRLIDQSHAVALMGSLPPGLPHDFYADLVKDGRNAHVPCLVDASGPVLEAALSVRPTYVKPNQLEVEALLGRGIQDWAGAAQKLRARGAKVALITRGGEEAILAGPDWTARLTPPTVPVVNATGAGDALAAGLLAAHLQGGSLREIAAFGMAVAAASVQHGYGRFHAGEIRPERVGFRRLS